MACVYGGVVSDEQFSVRLSFDNFEIMRTSYHGFKGFFASDEAQGHYIRKQGADGELVYVFDVGGTAALFKLKYG